MSKVKEFIQHELLNIFTIFNSYILGSSLSYKKQQQCFNLVQLASLMVSNEPIFLGNKPKFFLQNTDLLDFLETITFSYSASKKNQVTLIFPSESHLVKIDRYYLRKAIAMILEHGLDQATKISFSYNPKRSVLTIHHNAKNINSIRYRSLVKFLKSAKVSFQQLSLWLAFKILNFYGAKITIKRTLISIWPFSRKT